MENFKQIEVNGRTFRLNKLDARKGSFMLFKLIKILTPLLKGVNLDDVTKEEDGDKSFLDNIDLEALATSLFDLPESEFRFIQDNSLKAVQEILPGRNAPVLDENGNYGVLDVEFDVALLLNLTVQSIAYNVQGFFKGDLLSSIVKGSSSFPPSSQM